MKKSFALSVIVLLIFSNFILFGEKAVAADKKINLYDKDIYVSLAAFYFFLGSDYSDKQNYTEAIQTLEKGINFVTENRAVISDNVILSECYTKTL